MTEGGNTGGSEPATGLAYAQAYLTLFVAHWFGARRFNRAGSQDSFDPEDVQAYCAQRMEYLRKNFTWLQAVPGTASATPRDEEAAVEATGAAEQPTQGARAAEGGVGVSGDGAADEGADAGRAEAGRVEGGQADQARAGEVQVVTSKQVLPRFVLFQCFFMCALYAVFALKKSKEEGMTGTDPWLAGLDSISRGSTDLRWSGPNCEDYRHEVWRWITYQWTHIGVGHLLSNTILLIVFGFALEGHEGSFRMCCIFNSGVIAGALCWFVGGAHGCVVGSSGGVYALVGVQFEDLLMNWRERHFRMLTLAILLGYALVDALTWMASQDLTKSDYSYSTAFGGGLAGLVMGSYIGRNYRITRKDKQLMAGLGFLGCVLVFFALAWLGSHEAPINIFEAGSGENSYCWVGQFYNPSVNATSYQCIRCGTEECVQEWSLQETVLPVRASACGSQGWYFDGR